MGVPPTDWAQSYLKVKERGVAGTAEALKKAAAKRDAAAPGLESIRGIATHVAACARKGLGTDDLGKVALRELRA
jgi:hypothetical protein